MRQFIYVMALLAAAGLAACREDMMEGENAGEGVALAFRSGVEGLATEALAEEVGNVHVLVYDEAGNFVRREEFGGLDELRPVTLDLGRYTFAFVTDVPEASLEAGTTLEELTVWAEEAGDGGMRVGSVFAGTDSVTVGEDRTSEAELRRLVGRVDVRLEGVTGGARLERAWLLGSPSAARFTGEAAETDTVAMELPMTETADTGVYAGSAMAFPTVAETATLRFVMNEGGEERTYDVALRNRVEANKVNTVNARYDGTVEPRGVTLALEYEEEWGETLRDSVTADESLRMDWLTVKLVMEEGASTDLSLTQRGYLAGKNVDGTEEYLFAEFYLDSLPTMRGDTLVVRAEGNFYPGEYVLLPNEGGCELLTGDGMRLYTLGVETLVEVSADGELVVVLPAGVAVAEGDLQAMKDLRDVLLDAGVDFARQWLTAGDDVSQWDRVWLDENGRVIQLGFSRDIMKKNGRALAREADTVVAESPWTAIELPGSFAALTELRSFTLLSGWDLGLTDIPSYFKDFTRLEELVVNTEGRTLPELPASLRWLEVTGYNLEEIPASVGNLTRLEMAAFNRDMYDMDVMSNLSRIASVAADFSGMDSLQALYVVAAEECGVPESVWQCGRLSELYLFGFAGFRVPTTHALGGLTDLAVANNSVRSSDLEALGSTGLEAIVLACPSFGEGETPDWIGELSTLLHMRLVHCGIESIPASWDGLSGMFGLELVDCPNLSGRLPDGLLARYEQDDLSVYVGNCPNFSPTGAYLKVDTDKIFDAYGEGGTYTVEIESNRDWTVEVNDFPGMSVSPLSGSGNGTVTVTLEPNHEGWEGWEGGFWVWLGDGMVEYVEVAQGWSPAGQDSTVYYNRSVTH